MKARTTRCWQDEDEAEASEGASRTSGSEVESAVRIGGRPARILVVEDDPEMRRLLASSIRSYGYEVLEFPSGLEMLESMCCTLYKGDPVPIDIVVCDERMPGMLGTEVLAILRSSGWPTPFILITAFGDQGTHDEALRLGASAVIDKPLDLQDLQQTIVRTLVQGWK